MIKLGALGDLVLCARVFASLRAAYPQAKIALLTGPAFVSFAKSMPWFNEVLCDPRPSFKKPGEWLKLVREVAQFAPTRVYDFQGKFRQTILYAFLGGPFSCFWSGAAPFCKAPRLWPPKPGMHYTDFIAAQMDRARVPLVNEVDLSWFAEDISGFELPPRFALLIPGCAPSRLYKRWPPEHYAALALWLRAKGIASVLIGTEAEAEAIRAIKTLEPQAISLCGQTSLGQIASLARLSVCGVGNDTGPSHIAAAVGAKFVTLMPTDRVNAVWAAPIGPRAQWMGGSPLEALDVREVCARLEKII